MRKKSKSTYQGIVAFLHDLAEQKTALGINRDLSLEPELFHRPLRVKGLYVHGRALTEPSRRLSSLECDAIIYNETDRTKVTPPEENYAIFRLFDLQEFPYVAAVRFMPWEEWDGVG